MNHPLPECQHYYEKLASLRNGELRTSIEHVAMCRMLQSLNTHYPLQKIRRLQIVAVMHRAGGSTKDSDCCGFKIQYRCPYFKQRPSGEIDPTSA